MTPVDLPDRYTPPAVANGGPTLYDYNRDRQLTLVTRPDSKTVRFGYDGGGRLASLTIGRGAYTFGYETTSGQIRSVETPEGDRITYGYDGSLLTQATWTGAVTASIAWQYDDSFRVTTENVSCVTATLACQPVTFSYDDDDLLIGAGVLTLRRDSENGRLTGSVAENVSDEWTFTEAGEAATYTAEYEGTPLLAQQYVRDQAGRITEKTETIAGVTTTSDYAYDETGRLQGVITNGVTAAAYTYDENGNRLTKNGPHEQDSATYDSQDRLLIYNNVRYEYSASGELLSKTDPNGTTTYSYDELGNLLKVVLPDGRKIEYIVDGQNHRIGRKIDGVLVQRWIYAGPLSPIAELDGSGNVTARFIYGTRGNMPDLIVRSNTVYRVLSDHLESPRLIVDVLTGAAAQPMTFDEFGNVLSDTDPGVQPFGFAGGLYDHDTGLTRFGARDYDPHTGRWTAKDLILFDASGVNVYEYALGDPLNNYDPTGLDTVTADPHVQEMTLKLWEKASWGHTPPEVFAFITQDPNTGAYGCKQLPMFYEQNQFRIKKGTVIPANTIAVIHTHPNARTSQPDDPGDVAAANLFHKMEPNINALYTISKKGIGKYVPGAKHGRREESSLNFPNVGKDGCGCPK
jgi:RHS repeat-associated protein